MTYVDPLSIHDARTGHLAPSTWGDTVRDDLEFIVEKPMCQVQNTTTFTITNNTQVIASADITVFDTDAMHSTSTNNSRITIQTSGIYLIYGTLSFASNSLGSRWVTFVYNGSTDEDVQVIRGGTGTATLVNGTTFKYLEAAEYVEFAGEQDSGANLSGTLYRFGVQLQRLV